MSLPSQLPPLNRVDHGLYSHDRAQDDTLYENDTVSGAPYYVMLGSIYIDIEDPFPHHLYAGPAGRAANEQEQLEDEGEEDVDGEDDSEGSESSEEEARQSYSLATVMAGIRDLGRTQQEIMQSQRDMTAVIMGMRPQQAFAGQQALGQETSTWQADARSNTTANQSASVGAMGNRFHGGYNPPQFQPVASEEANLNGGTPGSYQAPLPNAHLDHLYLMQAVTNRSGLSWEQSHMLLSALQAEVAENPQVAALLPGSRNFGHYPGQAPAAAPLQPVAGPSSFASTTQPVGQEQLWDGFDHFEPPGFRSNQN